MNWTIDIIVKYGYICILSVLINIYPDSRVLKNITVKMFPMDTDFNFLKIPC